MDETMERIIRGILASGEESARAMHDRIREGLKETEEIDRTFTTRWVLNGERKSEWSTGDGDGI